MAVEIDNNQRVLAVLESGREVSRKDFNPPNVVDGGDPIWNFPDVISRLRKKGYSILTLDEPLANGGRAARYKLIKAPVSAEAGIPHTPPKAVAHSPRGDSRDGMEAGATEVVDPDDPWPPTDPSGGQLLMFPGPRPRPAVAIMDEAA